MQPTATSSSIGLRSGNADHDTATDYDSQLMPHCMEVLRGISWPEHKGGVGIRSLGITSCLPGEGVSTIAAHLAAAAAAYRRGPVGLVDCNFSRPAAHRMLQVPLAPGMIECLLASECPASVIRPTKISELFVISAGEVAGSPAQALGSLALPGLVKQLADALALCVFDLPPAGQPGSLTKLAGLLDGVVLVVQSERVTREAARRTQQLLQRAGVRVIGSILNHHPRIGN